MVYNKWTSFLFVGGPPWVGFVLNVDENGLI